MVSWINPHTSHKAIESGPVFFKNISGHEKAHLADPRGMAHVDVSYPVGVGMSVHCDKREGAVGESSRPPMESTVVSEMPEAPTGVKSALPSPDQAPVLPASNPVASHPDMEGDIVAPSTTVESRHPGSNRFALPLPSGVTGEMESPILNNGSQSHRRHQWVNQNRFSPLSELGNEMGTDQINKSESLGGFDFTKKSCKDFLIKHKRLIKL